MSHCRSVRVCALLLLWLMPEGLAAGQEPSGNHRPVINAVYVPQGIKVDGRLEEPIYRDITPTDQFIQQEPHEGQPGTEKTEVWVLFDDKNVYVAGRMWDSHPERMLANEMRRDAANEIYQNESLAVAFDTFHDQRSGVFFSTNILGAMRDVQFVSEKQINSEWNPIWNPRSQRFENGWTTEIEIPFKSLRYPHGGEQVWGIQLRRVVRWKNEITFLTRVPAAVSAMGIYRMEDVGTLVALRTPAASKNLEVEPYASSRLTTDKLVQPIVSNDVTGDVGVDVKYGVTQALTADFTYNTDFAQVEDDLQQVNLTRFGLFFPEKREFFLEGNDIFNFGDRGGGFGFFGSGGGSSPSSAEAPTMFFSRQIGLANGVAVPIQGGGRLTGKAGKYAIGIVDIQTAKSEAAGVPSTNFGVARLRRDIFGKSYVGVLATHRNPAGGRENTMVGADAGLGFGLTSIGLYYARTRTPGRTGRDASYNASYDYNGDRYGVNLQHLAVEPNFNPEVGFVRRRNFRTYQAGARFSPRPAQTNGALKAFRKFYYEGAFEYTTNTANVLESRAASVTFRADLENGAGLSAVIERDYEFLDAPFRIAPNVAIRPGAYAFSRVSGSYVFQPQLRVRGYLSANTGSFYDGTRSEARYSGRLDLSTQLIVEPTISLNWIDLPAGVFKTNLIQTRTTYMLSPRSTLGALVQYNSSTHTIASNIRFRWEYTPGSDLYVVYTEGRNTLVPDRLTDLQHRTFVVKVTRMFRY